MLPDRLSDRELQEDIDLLLFYRRLPPLSDMMPDIDYRSNIISMYRIVRHFMGEPVSVWFSLVFGENKRIMY